MNASDYISLIAALRINWEQGAAIYTLIIKCQI